MSELARRLGLAPHPEGGWYRETWRSPVTIPAAALPGDYGGDRAAATAILFLLNPGESSRWHRVRSGELWLWQGGGPLTLRLGGSAAAPVAAGHRILGPDPALGHDLQWLVEPGEWQAAEPAGPGHALVGCVVAPGFDFADFELSGER